MTEKRFQWVYIQGEIVEMNDYGVTKTFNNIRLEELLNELAEENEHLKSTIAQLIEQNRKNNDLLLSDIRILGKALWCGGCENDYGRLKELRKEFIR